MSPPLPVPSKAAIHALRGLALGTSCAIGVIVEDRRRRISMLRTAVANKEKLKASRHYHGALDYGTMPLDVDDAVFFNGKDIQWRQRLDDHDDHDGYHADNPHPQSKFSEMATRNTTEENGSLELPGLNKDISSTQEEQTVSPIQQPPSSSTQEKAPTGKDPPPSTPNIASNVRFPLRNAAGWVSGSRSPSHLRPKRTDPVSIAHSINEILSSHDEERLDRAMAKFFTCPEQSYMVQHVGNAWLEISVRLSKECQAQNRWEDASRVLRRVLGNESIDEWWYYAHDPLPVVESYLPAAGSDTACSLDAFTNASRFFLHTFKEKPQTHSQEIERIGERLLKAALPLYSFSTFHSIYWRVVGQLDNEVYFTARAIELLSESHDYKNVLKYFLLNFSKLKPDDVLFNETVTRVVCAVEAMQGKDAARVFRAYARMSNAGNGSLRTRWIMRLFQAHWNRHQDISKTKALFDEAKTLRLLDRVAHPQGVYRVMVELSLKADKHALANSYHEELIRLFPEMTTDVPLKGYFALAKAKVGDWEGVYKYFTEMEPYRHLQPEEYNEAFITVLKVFADNHPVDEVREFVTIYTRDLNVTLHRYVVTLVANKYGHCHDMAGFLNWLEYCHDAGFSLDPAVCNAVLHNCRTQWKLSFDQLRVLIRKIEQLNPSATDDTTQRILSQASRAGTKFKMPVNKLAYVGRSTNKRDVYEAMNQQIGCGQPEDAITIYNRAKRFGMPFCSHCFRLAVMAALALPNSSGPSYAFHMIHNAHKQGEDVNFAVSAFIRTQMDRFRSDSRNVLQHIQNLISRFEALHIVIDPGVLTHAAFVCVKLGQHGRAISLCELAMERSGAIGNPCFSRESFRALLMAYSQTGDADRLAALFDALLEKSDFCFEKKTVAAIKWMMREVRRYPQNPANRAVLDVLQQALAEVRAVRAEKQQEGKAIGQETLRIMDDAAAEFQSREAAKKKKRREGGAKGPPEEDIAAVGNQATAKPTTHHDELQDAETAPQQQQLQPTVPLVASEA